jgi:flagellar motor switch protein FliN/FliY
MGLVAGPLKADAYLILPRAAIPAPSAPPTGPLPPLPEAVPAQNGSGIEMLLDISLPITVELGRARMMIRDILHLAPGSVLELDKLAAEPVDILINDRSIARGEVVVIDENFGVRLTSIVTPSQRLMNLQ